LDSIAQYEKELEGKDIDVCLVGEREIKSLNKRFFGRDTVTDVLTFHSEFALLPYLGEIVINIESIMKERDSGNLEELNRVFIHGVLHLLGFDHINTEAGKQMSDKESFLLKNLN